MIYYDIFKIKEWLFQKRLFEIRRLKVINFCDNKSLNFFLNELIEFKNNISHSFIKISEEK